MFNYFKRLFGYGDASINISENQISGFFVGGAIGEALGLPVISKSEEQLKKEPVTDLLGFSDMTTPAGSYSLCEESQIAFASYLQDNFDGTISAAKFFELCNNWYLIKAKDEDARIRIVLPCAALSGIFYASMKKNRNQILSKIPDILCDEVVAPSALVFYIFMYISEGKNIAKSLKKALKSSKKLFKKIGLQISKKNFMFTLFDIITYCVSVTNDYQKGVLAAVNKGGNTDLVGNILGNLLGLFYGLENIPYFWRKYLGSDSELLKLSSKVNQMISCQKPILAQYSLYSIIEKEFPKN